MNISSTVAGRHGTQDVNAFTLENNQGMRVTILEYGATLQKLEVPGPGGTVDVVLGFDGLNGYLGRHPFFGVVAGRVANRIAGGTMEIEGKNYSLAINEPPCNHLHGGLEGFDKKYWPGQSEQKDNLALVRLRRCSPDGEEGYPGNLDICVTYSLNHKNELGFLVEATTDIPTPVNIVQHAYFNLGGQASGSIADHLLMVAADAYTPVDKNLIPTGALASVKGTPFDFRGEKKIGAAMEETGGGLDLNFALRGEKGVLRPCARLMEPLSGRGMIVETSAPGLQLYNGHKLGDVAGKDGFLYPACGGICLETQGFPNAINTPDFPSILLLPGDTYHHYTVYRFE